jgi:hypothetical protein
MGKEKDNSGWESPRGLVLFGLGSAFTALGLYIWHYHPNVIEHERKDKKIGQLQREIALIREAIAPKLCIEVTEATWQHHKKNGHGYTWRHPSFGVSEGVGKTHILRDHKNFPLMQAYFERINNHKSNLALVEATKHALGNSSLGNKKVLDVTYRCVGYDLNTKQYSVPLVYNDHGQEKDHITLEMKENEHHFIQCNEKDWRKK